MTQTSGMAQTPTRKNLNFALDALTHTQKRISANPIDTEDGELFLKLFKKQSLPIEEPTGVEGVTSCNGGFTENVGFVKLLSRKTNTFSDARTRIEQELVPDTLSSDLEWRFFVPGLGPVSNKQEASLGPMLSFLHQTTQNINLGDGTSMQPLKIFIVELKAATDK